MALYEALYRKRYHSPCLYKVKLIQEILRTTSSRQKIYDDKKVRDVAFMVGENVLLRVLPMKGMMRFGKKCKLSSQNIGAFEVIERVQLDKNLAYDEEKVSILDRQV
ncbi:uncharacterized protein [Nicotiana sylvestris]|uniref:uncharacterized protein n=1 Tax=Nicotiana sylvestris TaxID=4096 RepID=UPI00388CAB54